MPLCLAQEQILPFADNTEFLAMKLKEYSLRLKHVALSQAIDRETAEEESRSLYSLYPLAVRQRMEKAERLRRSYLKMRIGNHHRLAISQEVEIPFRELAAAHGLDPVEQEVVWMLFFKAVSLLFQRTYEDSGLYPFPEEPGALLCLGSLLQLLSPIPAIQIKLLDCFRPKGRLRRQGLVRLERPAARGTEVALETRLCLKEAVRERIIGAWGPGPAQNPSKRRHTP